MDHPLISLIDQAIAKAEREGQFDNLPGAGKPIDTSRDPMDALVERMREGAEVRSPIAVLRGQIVEAEEALKSCAGASERKAQMRVLSDLRLKLALEIEAVQRFG